MPLGRNLSIHPATAARARLDDEVRPWDGVPQSYYVDELAAEGIMLRYDLAAAGATRFHPPITVMALAARLARHVASQT